MEITYKERPLVLRYNEVDQTTEAFDSGRLVSLSDREDGERRQLINSLHENMSEEKARESFEVFERLCALGFTEFDPVVLTRPL